MADLVDRLGIASARIYAAFGSKEALFRETVALYNRKEGGFATRALAEEPTVEAAIERCLREAAEIYTRKGHPQGCMVVSAATNCAAENDRIQKFLCDLRRERTASFVKRLQQAVSGSELLPDTDVQTLGDFSSPPISRIACFDLRGWRLSSPTSSTAVGADRAPPRASCRT